MPISFIKRVLKGVPIPISQHKFYTFCREHEDREKTRVCQLIKDRLEQERKLLEQRLQIEEKERYVDNNARAFLRFLPYKTADVMSIMVIN